MKSDESSNRSRRPPEVSSLEANPNGQMFKSEPEGHFTLNEQCIPDMPQTRPQGKAKKHRKPSATPQPVTTTRLRSDLRSTPKGRPPASTLEHRRALHEQSLMSPDSKQSNPSKETVNDKPFREPAPEPLLPPRSLGVPNVSGSSEKTVIHPTNDLPHRVLYHHPSYGWGFMMQPSFPSPIQPECSEVYQPAFQPAPTVPMTSRRDSRHPTSDVPSDVPLGRLSMLASPFQSAQLMRDDVLKEHSILASPFQPTEVSSKRSSTPPENEQNSLSRNPAHKTFHQGVDPEASHLPSDSGPSTSATLGQDDPPRAADGGQDSMLTSSQSHRPDLRSDEEDSLLEKGFKALSDQLRNISASTRLTEEEILNRWKLPSHWIVDLFSVYRQYFKTRVDQELMRLPEELRPRDSAGISDGLVQETFRLFKADNPHYKFFLTDWLEIQDIAAGSPKALARSQQFETFIRKLEGVMECASALLGFETVSCSVGREIHTDQALSRTICSPLVPDFFSDRLRISESQVVGHLKAHAFNSVSRKTPPSICQFPMSDQDVRSTERLSSRPLALDSHAPTETLLAENDGVNGNSLASDICVIQSSLADGQGNRAEHCADISPSPSLVPRALAPSNSQLQEAALKSEAETAGDEHLEVEKQKKKRMNDPDMLADLKQRLFDLTKICQIRQLSSKTIQFAKLPEILAKHGWVLMNWPENLSFPCDIRRGKGVAGLGVQEQEILLKSLQDPHFPLHVVRKAEQALPTSEPIIIGVPPPPESSFTHGRRRFLDENGTSDRGGPPRLEPCATRSSSQSMTLIPTTKEGSSNALEVNQRKRPFEPERDDLGGKAKQPRLEKEVTFSPDDEETSSDSETDDGESSSQMQAQDEDQDGESTSSEDLSTDGRVENPTEASADAAFETRRTEVEEDPARGMFPGYRAAEKPSVPDVVVREYIDPYQSAPGAVPPVQPTAFWYPVQQTGAGQYPVNYPPGSPLFSYPPLQSSRSTSSNQGAKYQGNIPEASAYHHYQRSLGQSGAGQQQLLQIPTHAPLVPFTPQVYSQMGKNVADPRNNRAGGF